MDVNVSLYVISKIFFFSMEQRVKYLKQCGIYEKPLETCRPKGLARANCILSVVSYAVYTAK